MGIIRSDRRPAIKDMIDDIRTGVRQTLVNAYVVQNGLEELETMLGISQSGEINSRETYFLLHRRTHDDEPHTLDNCEERGCSATDEELQLAQALFDDDKNNQP